MKIAAALLFSVLAATSFGTAREWAQDKVDEMFLFPEENPFSFEKLYGSREAFETLKAPEQLEVYRIAPNVEMERQPKIKTILGHKVLKGPVIPRDKARAELLTLFAGQNTFADRPMCGGEPGVLLRASSRGVTVDLLFCFKCNEVRIARNDKREAWFDLDRDDDDIKFRMTEESRRKFLRLFQRMFPDDKVLRRVKP